MVAKTSAALLSEIAALFPDNTAGQIFPATLRTFLTDLVNSMLTQIDIDQVLVGGANVTAANLGTVSSGTVQLDCGKSPQQYLSNNGAFILQAPTTDGNFLLTVFNTASAGNIALNGFSVGNNVGDLLDTISGHVFTLSIWRNNGVAGYRIAAHQ